MVAEGDEEVELDYDSDGYPIVPDIAKVGLAQTTPTGTNVALLSGG